MRKQWPMIWCLTGMASLCWVGERALGQAGFEVPQYPQYVQYPQGAPPVTPAVSGAQVSLTADQIDQLLGPIALYPDPLLSLIFPAATYPQDVAVAEQWLAATPSPTEADIAAQSWDASIKGLVHYPTVLAMMSGQIDWTQAVGAAFVNQQKDVLNSVQRLRAQAQAAQNLQTTSQEQVLTGVATQFPAARSIVTYAVLLALLMGAESILAGHQPPPLTASTVAPAPGPIAQQSAKVPSSQ